MTSKARPRHKALWQKLHRWLGFSWGLLYLLMGLSGACLVFKDELLRVQYPSLAQPLPDALALPELMARFEARYPGFTLVRLPKEGQPWFLVQEGGLRIHYLDGQGRELLTRGRDGLALLEDFHHTLLLGPAGEWVLGAVAVGTLALLVMGLYLWWPRPGYWRQGLSLAWSSGGIRRWFDVHKVAGAISAIALLYSAGTGLMMTMDNTPQRLFTVFDRRLPPAPPKALPAPAGARRPWAELLKTAQAAIPDGRMTLLSRPLSPDRPLLVRMRVPGEWHPNGRGGVGLNPATGELVYRMDVREQEAGARAAYAMYPLHAGKVGGAAMSALLMVAGLTPALMFFSGTKLWLARRRRLSSLPMKNAA